MSEKTILLRTLLVGEAFKTNVDGFIRFLVKSSGTSGWDYLVLRVDKPWLPPDAIRGAMQVIPVKISESQRISIIPFIA